MANEFKEKQVAELKERFKDSPDFILTDYRGLTVTQISDLRTKLREHGVQFKVVKNNLAVIALKDLGVEVAEEYFSGPTSVAFAGEEAPAVAKALVDFEGKTSLTIKAGYIDGTFFGPDGVEQVSKMPGKKEILSQLAGGFNSILSKFAGDMRSVLTSFAGAIQALEQKKGE